MITPQPDMAWHLTAYGIRPESLAGSGAWQVVPQSLATVDLHPQWIHGQMPPLESWFESQADSLQRLRQLFPAGKFVLTIRSYSPRSVTLDPRILSILSSAGIGLELATADPRKRAALHLPTALLLAAVVGTSIIGLMLIAADIETIVATGPILLILGIALATIAAIRRDWWPLAAGGLSVFTVLFLLLAIVIGNLGPTRALPLVAIVGVLHTLLLCVLAVPSLVRSRKQREPWECQKCGYALVGLPGHSSRCPECGEPFDDRSVAASLAAREMAASSP